MEVGVFNGSSGVDLWALMRRLRGAATGSPRGSISIGLGKRIRGTGTHPTYVEVKFLAGLKSR